MLSGCDNKFRCGDVRLSILSFIVLASSIAAGSVWQFAEFAAVPLHTGC
jgi:hypothetical protein